ncbi:MAG: DUF4190 domain-containing protein [Candidatus Eremiobacterota bacterium]
MNCTSCFAYIYPEEEEYKRQNPPEDTRKYNPLSIVSLVLGIAGIVVCICYPLGILDSIGAIITGIMAKKNILTNNQKGEKPAQLGIILGIIGLAGSITMAVIDGVWKITSLYGTGQ